MINSNTGGGGSSLDRKASVKPKSIRSHNSAGGIAGAVGRIQHTYPAHRNQAAPLCCGCVYKADKPDARPGYHHVALLQQLTPGHRWVDKIVTPYLLTSSTAFRAHILRL
ncbi:hypothetical protein RRG08_047126 [Elysia crispata]|uniref:Uncharacterized protein n=1 Tax=Elysia crispata TaxID=231223 RepID=A0AAE1E378_9GAST|nr:hypothetical protein RRG08_047126 [Elysia crispata]